MKKTCVFTRCAAFIVCCLGAAQAQGIFELPKGKVEVAGFGGIVSGFGSNGIVGGGANVAVTNRLLVGGEFGYIPGGNRGISPVGGIGINTKAYEITGGVNYRFLWKTRSSFRILALDLRPCGVPSAIKESICQAYR